MRSRKGASIAERLAHHTIRDGDCLVWTGGRAPSGYGKMNVGGKWGYAHRLAWQEANGPLPAGMCVCHRCDNPPCVNPDHLFLGTHTDNAADKVAKGRHARGEMQAMAKLNAETVREIRRSAEPDTALAKRLGVSSGVVWKARTGWTWGHVT